MSEITDVAKDSVKEPEEPDHEAKCHLLNNPDEETVTQNGEQEDASENDGKGSGDTTKDDETGGTEKGQLDEEPEASKDETDGWLYVLGHELLKKKVNTVN